MTLTARTKVYFSSFELLVLGVSYFGLATFNTYGYDTRKARLRNINHGDIPKWHGKIAHQAMDR